MTREDPRQGEWVYFEKNIKQDSLEKWGAVPEGYSKIRLLFEVRYDANRIYVTNVWSAAVSIIDGETNTVAATMEAGERPRGIGVNPMTGRFYVADEERDEVLVLDAASNQVVATVAAGDRAWSIAVNPDTNRIYVADGSGNTVWIIDGDKDEVMATIPIQHRRPPRNSSAGDAP